MPVTVAGLPFDFVKANTASGAAGFVMKSTRDAYYFNAGVLTKITDVDYQTRPFRALNTWMGIFS